MNEDNDRMGTGNPVDASPGKVLQTTEGLTASEKDERMWGMLTHLTALSGLLGVPFGNIIGPLVVWLLKKDDYPSVDAQGKASLNFQISMTIYGLVLFGLGVLTFVFLIGFLFFLGAIVVCIVWAICTLVASVKTSNGEPYEYPFTIRFLQ